ncbi:helix-turn-helix domain-containing protein [Streptomyces durmitorensis]|uniref:Helix-turn-helix domain-containing protein n=1 Tax=Streptomyces durmitorensis TaxID=319947 RepID=A0ABY4PV37_9ACTN|nr:PucR family transcriptional regulator [Streptomyces durmitorensis]UQT57631.1 helix-turn-helix domain-containing protein [Streptomyces durmitorensis]
MTGDKSVGRFLIADVPGLAATVTRRIADGLPVYGRLPAEELHGDVRAIVVMTIRAFAEVLRTERMPPPEFLETVRRSAARRAEERLPVDAVVSAYHYGARICVEEVAATAEPQDLIEAHRLLLDCLREITAAVTSGYVEESQSLIGERDAARHTALSALLDGLDDRVDAGGARLDPAHLGIRLPPCYLVLAFTIGRHPDEDREDVDATVASRRKIRRLRTELDRALGHPVLSRLSADEGLALIPSETAPDRAPEADRARLENLTRSLITVSGVPLTAGVAASAPADVPHAVRLATELRDTAVGTGRPPGVYPLTALLLDYQLTRASPARAHLAALLSPLAEGPDLTATLRTYFASNLDRRRTAARLHVHPNTVDYRLRRIAALTGLDVAAHTDLLTLRAALTAYDASGTS